MFYGSGSDDRKLAHSYIHTYIHTEQTYRTDIHTKQTGVQHLHSSTYTNTRIVAALGSSYHYYLVPIAHFIQCIGQSGYIIHYDLTLPDLSSSVPLSPLPPGSSNKQRNNSSFLAPDINRPQSVAKITWDERPTGKEGRQPLSPLQNRRHAACVLVESTSPC